MTFFGGIIFLCQVVVFICGAEILGMCLNAALNQIAMNLRTTISFCWISNQNVPEQNAETQFGSVLQTLNIKKDLLNDFIINKTADVNQRNAPLANCIIIPFLISSFSVRNFV